MTAPTRTKLQLNQCVTSFMLENLTDKVLKPVYAVWS